jgi:1-acyl-sn-glycerol-3-phosphate acyltransferase
VERGVTVNLFYKVTTSLFRVVYTILYHHRVEWEVDPKKIKGGAVIAPNHVSYLDPQLVSGSWPGDLSFFAGSYLFKHPFLGFLLRMLCCHPVEKGRELSVIRTAIRLLRQGKKVALFPEGTRSNDGTLQPFRDGVAFLALQSRCPIIPCYIGGTYEAWPKSRKWPRFWGVRTFCRFGRPISPFDAHGNLMAKEKLNELLYEAISRLGTGKK